LTPAVPTGAAPSSGESSFPAPVQSVTVKVGGSQASTTFVGDTPGLVGVIQINYQIPATVATGIQPVTVTINGVVSPSVNLTVTN